MSTRNNRQRSVNDRIRRAADAQGVDANRLRRGLVFQRLLVRLAPHGVVLKGGYCLEVRLPGVARVTKDMDLVGHIAIADDPAEVQDALDELLDDDSSKDDFTFRVGRPVRLRDSEAEDRAWRVSVAAYLGGAQFETVKIDLVGQIEEVLGATEPMTVDPPVAIPGIEGVIVEAVDIYQHAAEKLHAYSRMYAHDRPSSRVKDLVDLVLMIEAGLLVDHSRLRDRLLIVHSLRDNGEPGAELPAPPRDWAQSYAAVAHELALAAETVDIAYARVAEIYQQAVSRRRTQ
ncbi:MAG: nucleotidyl transferase AbiEii/AbiGii toxin family protein [Gordonia amarae]